MKSFFTLLFVSLSRCWCFHQQLMSSIPLPQIVSHKTNNGITKLFFTLLFIVANSFFASAQWSNTKNVFTDSLHTPVCTAANEQIHPVVIQSYPDKGYFIVWEDKRVGGFYGPYQVYAQKYDKDGNKLWATDGIPVSSGTNSQHFTWPSNEDSRNRKIAASDEAGGSYITYTDDSIATYLWQRMCVQHITPGGNTVFPGAGFIAAQTPAGESYNYDQPQLIGDNDGGFFVGYIQKYQGAHYMYVENYTDQGGTMKSFGRGLMNENIANTASIGLSGNQRNLTISLSCVWPVMSSWVSRSDCWLIGNHD